MNEFDNLIWVILFYGIPAIMGYIMSRFFGIKLIPMTIMSFMLGVIGYFTYIRFVVSAMFMFLGAFLADYHIEEGSRSAKEEKGE